MAELAKKKGRDAYRLILPEYYKKSCLGCHGGPKGSRDITGGKREGGKEGQLGGAISVTLSSSWPARVIAYETAIRGPKIW